MQRNKLISLMACLPLLAAAHVFAADPAALYKTCATCHGDAGQGDPAVNAPALAGQGAAYLERQLRNFQSGVRGATPADTLGQQMKAMAATVPQADIPALSAWLSQLPPPPVAAPQAGDLRNGNNFYQGKCGACHGGKAEGNPGLNAPALAWLDADYLRRQFANFQQGLRGGNPDDTYGRQMRMMSTSLPTDKDLDDVIAYMHSLAPGP